MNINKDRNANNNHITVTTHMEVLDGIDAVIDPLERVLCVKAGEAIETSYAPYSEYRVGAAVLLNNDKIISGANQENAVFPLGLCAERVAIFSALSQFSDIGIRAIAIKTEKVLGDGELPGFPCGSCRQSMVEMEARFDQQMKVFVFGRDERVYVLTSAKDLLPFAFDQKAL